MVTLLGNLIAVVALGLIVLRKGRDESVGRSRPANGLMIISLVPLGLQVAIYLLFALGEMAGGDLSGASHLLPAATILILGLLAWRRPLEGGAALLLLGLLTAAFYGRSALPITWPLPLSGALLLASAILARRATLLQAGHGR